MLDKLQNTEAEAISEMALGSDIGNDAAILLAMAQTNPAAYREQRQRTLSVCSSALDLLVCLLLAGAVPMGSLLFA